MLIKNSVVMACALALVACAGVHPTHVGIRPAQGPVANQTGASDYLSCIGSLVDVSGRNPLDIEVGLISDSTVPIYAESSFLPRNSGTFYARSALAKLKTDRVALVSPKTPMAQGRGRKLLEGALSEFDRITSSNSLAPFIRLSKVQLDFGRSRIWHRIGMDLEMVDIASGRSHTNVSTTLAVFVASDDKEMVVDADDGDEVAGSIAYATRSSEGIHAGSRELVEHGIATIVARWFEVPVETCLDSVDPAYQKDIARRFNKLSKHSQVRSLQVALDKAGFRPGKIDGVAGPETISAIKRCQLELGDPPTGHVTADLYVRLIFDDSQSKTAGLVELSHSGSIYQYPGRLDK